MASRLEMTSSRPTGGTAHEEATDQLPDPLMRREAQSLEHGLHKADCRNLLVLRRDLGAQQRNVGANVDPEEKGGDRTEGAEDEVVAGEVLQIKAEEQLCHLEKTSGEEGAWPDISGSPHAARDDGIEGDERNKR